MRGAEGKSRTMQFKIFNQQTGIPIDEPFWLRAFEYGARELGIEHFACGVGCIFVPLTVKTKIRPVNIGYADLATNGAIIWVKVPPSLWLKRKTTAGGGIVLPRHELTHAKQYLSAN